MQTPMTPTPAATSLSLTVIRASQIKWVSSLVHSERPNLHVHIKFNNVKTRTRAVKLDLLPQWDETFSFEHPSAGGGTKFIIQIRHSSSWKDKCVGKTEVGLDDLLQRCADGKETELHLKMSRNSKLTETTAILHLRLKIVDTMSGAGHNVNAARQAVQQSGISSSAATTDTPVSTTIETFGTHLSGYAGLYQSVENLVSKLDVFVSVVDKLSQVHPYINFTWQVASMLYKSISHQFEVDKKVVELVRVMEDAFSFVQDAEFLRNKTQSLRTTITQLLRQTNECCLFIKEYARDSFIGRMIKIDVDGKVDEFNQSLCLLKQSIESGVIIQTAFVSLRMSSEINTIFLSDRLRPDRMDAFSRPQCLPGTRTEIVQQIVEWTLSDSDQNVFWLYGVAGSGKSTVSTTIAEHFRGISRLGAHLFFERGQSDPSSVIRTLVYKLASFDSTVEDNVIAAIKRDNNIAEATAATQFENLLHSPLVSSRDAMQGPVVIVLDALDECGTERSRQSLMQSFRRGLRLLPKNFRFLITSRRESDINQVFFSAENICAVGLDHTSGTCKDDVLHYLDYELRNVFAGKALRIPDDWQDRMDRLAGASEGLFVWASTAVKLVDCDNPARALQDLVSHSSSLSGLDQLYESILLGSGIRFNSETSKERFSQVLGLILLSRIPLSEDTIDGLLGYSVDEPSRLILSRLQSVLVYTPAAPIYFFHTSFRDYLTSSSRCNDAWFIDLDIQKKLITKRCFDVMKRMLRFNICKIESSYIRNDQILDLSERIKEKIPSYMEYACLFWGQHLHEAQFSDALSSELLEFLHKRFLYWLEVMSLLKKANTASPALLLAMNWVSSYDAHILAFLRDARRIITVYFPCISQSTSHIYVSFLPLASLESKFIADNYLRPNLPIVQVEHIGMKQRSPLLKTLGFLGSLHALAFSPDNMRIAGYFGTKIQIWDAESGQVISGPFEVPFERETFGRLPSAFSPDLERIVSIGSDTGTETQEIRVWEVDSGKVVSLEGHTDEILVVAFSPDGKHVVSGSADTTIVVWKIDSKEPISVRFAGHTETVLSVAFSHDGKRIVSGSDDSSIRLWDLESGHLICEPLEGHTESVTSVAFSHDGTRIVSGSVDSTIRIWDARSGQCISEPFRGHTSGVQCAAFSPNGRRVVSGSTDNTVRIWDVETGKVVSGPYEAHYSGVDFVAFSPDGTRVISCDGFVIRIWDAEGEQANLDKFEGHEDTISSVAFSPDGKLVVSGSFDGTIRVWDAESGCTVSGPFKGHSEQSEKILSISFSPDGERVVSGSGDGTILVWDVGSGEIVSGPFKGHEDRVESVSFSADGARVISGSLDGTIRFWDVHSGQTSSVSRVFRRRTQDVESVVSLSDEGCIGYDSQDSHKNCRTSGDQRRLYTSKLSENDKDQDGPDISSIAFSPDGVRAASGFEDGTFIVWDVKSGEVISGPLKEHESWVYSVAFSRDGTNIVSGDGTGTIIIWDAKSGQIVRKLSDDHTALVVSLAFSSDGTRVVSGSYDNTIRVWDVKSRQTIFAPFEGHTDWVRSVAFSPDGSRVVSSSWDCTIRIWNVKDPVFDWTLDKDDEWIRGPKGELLFWVPPDDRHTLWRPRNTAIFGCQFSTQLDFTNAALGERWEECFAPPK